MFNKTFDMLYKKDVKPENPFLGKKRFPIGTKRPHYVYGDEIPESEIVYFDLPVTAHNDSTSFIFVGKAGTQKTRLIKRFVYYYKYAGFKIGIMDLKGGIDWPKTRRAKAMNRLHPMEEPGEIDIIAGSPSFAVRVLTAAERSQVQELNIPMSHFGERKLLATLGFSPGAMEIMMGLLKKGATPKQIEKMVKEDNSINRQSQNNILVRIGNIIEENFFTTKKKLEIDKLWDQNKAWAIGFFNQDMRYVSAYVDKLMRLIKLRADKMDAANKKEKYFIVIDDSHVAAGRELNPDIYASVRTCINSLVLWRSLGVNMCFAVQSPTLLNSEIYGNCKYYFISKTSKIDVMRDYVHNWEIYDAFEKLDYRPKDAISQWLAVEPDGYSWFSFYPFNTPLAH